MKGAELVLSPTSCTVSWSLNPPQEYVDHYNVYWGSAPDALAKGPDVESLPVDCTLAGLSPTFQGQGYVAVTATNVVGESPKTAPIPFLISGDVNLSLTGNVKARYPLLHQGETQVCIYTVHNPGPRDLTNQRIRQLVVNLDDHQETGITEHTLDLAAASGQTMVLSLETEMLLTGQHACVLRAKTSEAWQSLAHGAFELLGPPIQMELGDRGRLLVLLDAPSDHPVRRYETGCEAVHSIELGLTFEPRVPAAASTEIQFIDAEDSWCQRKDSDPHGPEGAPELTEQRRFLEALLESEGWSYTIVTDKEDFTRELRTGGYSVYSLFAEAIELDGQMQRELREAVYRGEGLLLGGTYPQRLRLLDEVLSVSFPPRRSKGEQSKVRELALFDSPLGPANAVSLAFGEESPEVELIEATPVGLFDRPEERQLPTDKVALALGRYGGGRSVYAGFDLLAQATIAGEVSVLAEVLSEALAYIHPDTLATLPGAVVPIRLKAAPQGIETPLQGLVNLPAGSQLMPWHGTALEQGQDGQLAWYVDSSADGELKTTFWLRLPDESGTARVEAENSTDHSSKVGLNIPVRTIPSLRDVQDRLTPWREGRWKSYAYVSRQLRQAERLLAEQSYQTSLEILVSVSEHLARVDGPEAHEARTMLAYAIRDMGRRWAAFTGQLFLQP